jgi:hypothetical protein
MTLDADLLDKTLHHIETLDAFEGHVDDRWVQQWWISPNVCGTSACFAGWTCVLAGDTLDAATCDAIAPDGTRRFIPDRARELLGIDLDTEPAEYLFAASNDLDDIRRIVGQLKADG